MRADGYSLTTQRTPTPDQNDIPDLISRFHNLDGETNRKRTAQSFFVPLEEIRENGYDLSYKCYKEVIQSSRYYEEPEDIINRMKERQEKIEVAFIEFQKLLNS